MDPIQDFNCIFRNCGSPELVYIHKSHNFTESLRSEHPSWEYISKTSLKKIFKGKGRNQEAENESFENLFAD